MHMLKDILGKLIDGGKLGGWVRAGVAAGLTMLVAKLSIKIPVIAQIISPDTIDYVAVAAGTFVAGLWQQHVKPAA
jgi:hypothetical protein